MFLPLYWLYIWQIKEYRWDRLYSQWKQWTFKEKLVALLWGRYRRPTFTPKLILIGGIAAVFGISCVLQFGVAGQWSWFYLLVGSITAWFTLPIDIAIGVTLATVIEEPIKQRLIRQAHSKASLMLQDSLVIGITGSYGKTTTKEFIGQILEQNFHTIRTPKRVNQTTALAQYLLRGLDMSPEIFIAEFASYGIGNITYDTKNLVRPDWAVMTGIAPQHVELFGSIENILLAKFELLQSIPPDGIIFYNHDDELLREHIFAPNNQQLRPYSADEARWYIDQLSWGNTIKGRVVAHLFAQNVAAAIAVAKELQLEDAVILAALETITWLPRTVDIVQTDTVTLLDDSYSSNTEGLRGLIHVANQEPATHKLLITSGVIELGDQTVSINRELSREAARVFDTIMVSGVHMFQYWKEIEQPETIMSAAVETVRDEIQRRLNDDLLIIIAGRIPEKIRKEIYRLLNNEGQSQM